MVSIRDMISMKKSAKHSAEIKKQDDLRVIKSMEIPELNRRREILENEILPMLESDPGLADRFLQYLTESGSTHVANRTYDDLMNMASSRTLWDELVPLWWRFNELDKYNVSSPVTEYSDRAHSPAESEDYNEYAVDPIGSPEWVRERIGVNGTNGDSILLEPPTEIPEGKKAEPVPDPVPSAKKQVTLFDF